jgi:hypothetical protein
MPTPIFPQPQPDPFFLRFDDDWLEPVKHEEIKLTPCCPRCRRGTPAHGTLPCGYPTGCPNPSCTHHTATR